MFEPIRPKMRSCLCVVVAAMMLQCIFPGVFGSSGDDDKSPIGPRVIYNDEFDLIVPAGEVFDISGYHAYARSVVINGTVKVRPYNGADQTTGTVSISAPSIFIGLSGKLVADGRGYGGGGGGANDQASVTGGRAGVGGRGGDGQACSWNGAYILAKGGGGGGSNGGNGSVNYGGGGTGSQGGGGGTVTGGAGGAGGSGFGGGGGGGGGAGGAGGGGGGGTGGLNGAWNSGGAGGGPFPGAGGSGTSGAPSASGNAGHNGGYMALEANGDSTTDMTSSRGSGGGGGGTTTSGSYGGGGGGGGAGGGSIVLISDGNLTVHGTISANGAGGGKGGVGGGATGGDGGGGAGGGIVLSGMKVSVDGTVSSQGMAGGSLTQANGGTVKIFHVTESISGGSIVAGRIFENRKPSVVLVSPAPDAVTTHPVFCWTGSDAEGDPILGYELLVYNSSDLSSFLLDLPNIIETSFEYAIQNEELRPEFFWKVRAKGAGGYGLWTPIWRLRTDDLAPSSSVAPLPAWQLAGTFRVSWSGTDNLLGIANYTILVVDNVIPWSEPWLSNTTKTFSMFAGQDGHRYSFFSIAVDLAGNTEEAPETPDTNTTVDLSPPRCVLQLAPYQTSEDFTVSWYGWDNVSGRPAFTVFFSDNTEPYEEWLTNVSVLNATFEGTAGHTYGFSVRGRDAAGNVEDAAAQNTLTTLVDIAAPQTTGILEGKNFGSWPVYILPATSLKLETVEDFTLPARTQYKLDAAAVADYTAPLGGFSAGGHNITYWSEDGAGNREWNSSLWFFVDGDAPVTDVSFDGRTYKAGDNVFITSDTQFIFESVDVGSGVASTTYHFDALAAATYSSWFKLDMPGAHILHYGSVDNLGNREKDRTLNVVLDTTAPNTTVDAPKTAQNKHVTVNLAAVDAGSGVAATYYHMATPGHDFGDWGNGTEVDIDAPDDHSGDGTYKIEFLSSDNLGNNETVKWVNVTIDTRTWLWLSVNGTIRTERGSHRLRGNAEPGSRVTVNGESIILDDEGSFSLEFGLHEGSNRFEVVATDAAGNSITATGTIDYVPVPVWAGVVWGLTMTVKLIILATWFSPFLFLAMALAGWSLYRSANRKKPSRKKKPERLIIQVTTVGNDTVDEIVRRIKAYKLPLEIWVVKEPGDGRKYAGADRVIVVPKDFKGEKIQKRTKATALEYSKRYRDKMMEDGTLDPEYRLVFIDDDSIPSKEYLEEALWTDAHMLQGMICPTNKYGTLMSYLDNVRTFSCITMCALFQQKSRPVWIHGEALMIKGWIEQTVDWDQPLISSEDLVFGHLAVASGVKMRYTYNRINITNPLSLRDCVAQRRRWAWGNIHAIGHPHLLPRSSKMLIASVWLMGLLIYAFALIGTILVPLGMLTLPFQVVMIPLSYLSLFTWLGMWGAVGYINGGKAKDVILSILLSFPAVTLHFFAEMAGLLKGDPKTFETIRKEV